MGTLEIVDRRGANKVEIQAAVAVEPKTEVLRPRQTSESKNLTWRSTGYTLVFLPNGQNPPLLSGRAVGMRTDERVFTADWLLPPVWGEKESWQEEARKRLDTFKKCSCKHGSRCEFHRRKTPSVAGPGDWIIEDLQRLEKVQSRPLPECLEVLMKAEMARTQSRVVVPGQG